MYQLLHTTDTEESPLVEGQGFDEEGLGLGVRIPIVVERGQEVVKGGWDRRRVYKRESLTALAYAAIMLFVSVFGKWPVLRAVTSALALCRLFAAVYIAWHLRALNSFAAKPAQTGKSKLYFLLDRDPAFVGSVLYWYALPLSAGLLGIAYAFWQHARSVPIVTLCLALSVGTVIGTHKMNAGKLAQMESFRKRPAD